MSLSASPEERLIAPPIRTLDRRYAASLALGVALHAVALAFLLYRDDAGPTLQPPEEIPVELVQEVPEPAAAPQPEPPPQEKPAEPEQQQQQATLDEAPATDAPRQRSEEESRNEAPQPAKTPTAPAQATAAATPPPPSAAPPVETPPQPAPAPPLPTTAEADLPPPELRREAALPTPTPPAPEPPAPPKQRTLADVLGSFEPLPNYEFAAPARMSPIAGGDARTTYLSIIFGMVKQHMRPPPRRNAGGAVTGVIAFQIDRNGRLMQARIAKPSGAPELDGAALAAVRAASPFPRTPTGTPVGLIYSYEAN